ncbi:MAG: adenine phosphoribosyltransferase [Candidatus Wallbacteria bacterium]|nr:adenine phosphoribosyltransferase [Candidatus Wallbacteria bacterium]
MILRIKKAVRDVPDFPKKGIVFKDITPVLRDPTLLKGLVDELARRYAGLKIDYVAGIESRGFILAAPVATALSAGFVPIRKKGKLPCETYREDFKVEYGTDSIEMHKDAFGLGNRVLLLDDVLATGGTASAAIRLIEKAGGRVAGVAFMIELNFLEGRAKLGDRDVYSLIQY